MDTERNVDFCRFSFLEVVRESGLLLEKSLEGRSQRITERTAYREEGEDFLNLWQRRAPGSLWLLASSSPVDSSIRACTVGVVPT